jgi:hypothetical protein
MPAYTVKAEATVTTQMSFGSPAMRTQPDPTCVSSAPAAVGVPVHGSKAPNSVRQHREEVVGPLLVGASAVVGAVVTVAVVDDLTVVLLTTPVELVAWAMDSVWLLMVVLTPEVVVPTTLLPMPPLLLLVVVRKAVALTD